MANVQNGTLKRDFYYTGDNSHQEIVGYETPSYKVTDGTKVSVAVGKDVRGDRNAYSDPTVVDIFATQNVFDHVDVKGRVRTSYSDDNATTQFRLGLQGSVPVGDNGSVYAQVYAADKVDYKKGSDRFSVGAFAGYEHRFSDNFRAYVEAQSYDLGHTDRENLGVNMGVRYSF